jgi:beta-lactamase class A
MKLIKTLAVALFMAVLGSFFLGQSGTSAFNRDKDTLKRRYAAWKFLRKSVKERAESFNGEACVVIKDLDTGWEISNNKFTSVPAASIIKIPVMCCAMEAVDDGEISLDDTIVLKSSHIVSGSGKLKLESPGKHIEISRLLRLMITESDNTATNMIINLFGFDRLNEYFKKRGLRNTNIARLMMDMKSRDRGVENYTTAQDMAVILEDIYCGKIRSKGVSDACLELLKQQKMKDRIPKKLPEGTVVAHKTGLERGVCHDVGIVYTPNGNFLISVLTRHRNPKARLSKKFIADVAKLAYEYYESF